MLNQCVLVGRLKEWKADNMLTIAIPRSYKNEDGEYDTDFIDITIDGKIQESTKEYCHKGDILGVKARIESGNKLIAEKVTFLSSRSKNEDDE